MALDFKCGKIKALGPNNERYIIYNSKDVPMGDIKYIKNEYKYSCFDDQLIPIECWNEIERIVKELNSKLKGNERKG